MTSFAAPPWRDFGPGDVRWRKPSEAAIRAMLTNTAYAGAFVDGRRTSEPRCQAPGEPTPSMVHRKMDERQCILQDIYRAYISRAQYLANQARLHENAECYTDQMKRGRGAPREGAALLHGLATCGLCGHRMRVAYVPRALPLHEYEARIRRSPLCPSRRGPPSRPSSSRPSSMPLPPPSLRR